MSTCIACRVGEVAHKYSGTCVDCDEFIRSLANPALTATREKYTNTIQYSQYNPKIGYEKNGDTFKIELCGDCPELCLEIRDYLCQCIGINIDTSKRISNYVVRVSRPTSYHLPGEFHVYQDDNTKDVNTATAIKIFVVKRDFKLS